MITTIKLTFIFISLSFSQFLYAQVNDTTLIQKIISAAKTQEETSSILRVLTDSIGGRITGTSQSKETSAFLLKKLKEIGIDNAHLEDFELKTSWAHNSASGRIINPTHQFMVVGSYGWCPGTKGEITAKVVDLRFFKNKKIPERFEGIMGAAVIVEPIAFEDQPSQVTRILLANALAKSGAAAMLIPSDKPNRLLYISAFGFYPMAPLPVISIAKEDALLLHRILEYHPVTITLNINNSISNKASKEFNVIGDIPGTDTVGTILIGAHFDSWDYGQGAQDNGSGVAAIMEVARIFKQLDIKPKHTIRFAFFSGEEQGLLGSHAYVIKHANELDKLKSVLIMDDGAQVPKGFMIHGRSDLDNILSRVFQALSPLEATGISADASFDTDHAPFLAEGIPSFTLWVNEGDYDINHHSITDTYDKVDAGLLATDTAVLAVAVYSLDQHLKAVNNRLFQDERKALMKKNGLESVQKMLSRSWR
ncbi:MAG TPA: M20/M25/M40 family metallo-hydrolase [Ignavibacteriaceae bacterium]|jgi:Zn-dependent M28 family amino/carboxypeptidase|nr:MAG: hypothetical protein B6D44_02450 [Ignavibacteriales bacterium UTCHB2]HQF42950.1 M20/M25/M40 family metallo-hydrolase [Ignavibacteriaceae bacterium]HQI40736.1 M20/M25/M40 family metallo-hydrolase [Ignavibacteriaceae bacterium]